MKTVFFNYSAIEPQCAGASLIFFELTRLMRANLTRISSKTYDFKDIYRALNNPSLAANSNIFASLEKEDTVVCNFGPYAWLIHYIRKKYNKRFRIIRFVQSALWDGDLFQELICSKLLQPEDILLLPSHYSKSLYLKLFPNHLNINNTIVCYPLLDDSFNIMPELKNSIVKPKKQSAKKPRIVLGWIGRLSDDKNFFQALNIYMKLSKILEHKVFFHILGPYFDDKYSPDTIKKLIFHKLGFSNQYKHFYNGKFVYAKEKSQFWKSIDILLFLSTGNVESLGRVLIEANHFKVKVAGANHGAASSLIPLSNLARVDYFKGEFYLGDLCALGRVDESCLINKIINNKLQLGSNKSYLDHTNKFIGILKNRDFVETSNNFSNKFALSLNKPILNKEVNEFINKLTLYYKQEFRYSDLLVNMIDQIVPMLKNGLKISQISPMLKKIKFMPYCRICYNRSLNEINN